jgi:hypothetical protein
MEAPFETFPLPLQYLAVRRLVGGARFGHEPAARAGDTERAIFQDTGGDSRPG